MAQIVAEHNAEFGEDEGRAEIASILEFAERKTVDLINDPGCMMAPNGRPAVDGDGEPIPNKGLVVEAVKTLVLVSDKKSRLFGWDKRASTKMMNKVDAEQAMWAAIAAERQRKLEAESLSDSDRREFG